MKINATSGGDIFEAEGDDNKVASAFGGWLTVQLRLIALEHAVPRPTQDARELH